MRWMAALFVTMMLLPAAAYAQADEIQVYDGGLAAPGVFNITLHNNFIAKGITTPAFPGAVAADKSFNGVPEWAYGVNRWFELGLYLPLYSRDDRTGWGINGFKLRTLFAVPNADDRTFFYGANIEYSFNADRWDTKGFTSEVRPIVGWHLGQWDLIFNPIIDTAYDGLNNLEFVPGSLALRTTSHQSWRSRSRNTRTTGSSTTSRRKATRPTRSSASSITTRRSFRSRVASGSG